MYYDKKIASGLLIALLSLQLIGCASSGTGGSGGTTTPIAKQSGNWEFYTGSTTAPVLFLRGFIDQRTAVNSSDTLTASLEVQPGMACYPDARVLDFNGFATNSTAQLTSFNSYAHVITLGLSTSSSCAAGIDLCGSYKIAGGCADGNTGGITGVRYVALTGTYRTPANSTPGLTMTLTQDAQGGTGQGTYQMSGSLQFTGACATAGTVDPVQSYVTGSVLHIVSTSDAPGAPVLTIDGQLKNPKAPTITINGISLVGNTCLGPLQGANLS